MGVRKYVRSSTRINYVLLVFLFVIQTGVHTDVVEVPLEDSNLGVSSVNTTLDRMFGNPIISVTCQGTKYKCDEITKYDVHRPTWVIIKSCAPNILKCLSDMYPLPKATTNLEIHDLVSPGTAEEWQVMSLAWNVRFYLKDSDGLPNIAINSLPALKHLYIEGATFELPSNFDVNNKTLLTHLELNKNGLTKIPANAFLGLTFLISLTISANHFESIDLQAFRDLHQLEELTLKSNEIKSLKLGSNSQGTNRQLKLFKMDHNSVDFLPNDIFKGYYLLEKIIIQNNQVELKLDTHAFSHLSPSVKLLEMSNCKIHDIPDDLLEGSSNVHNINWNHNSIESLHPKLFSYAYSVRGLTLSGNKINAVSDVMFSNVKKLELLDLSNNHIRKLSGDVFQSNSKLRILNLNNNEISELGKDIFKGKSFQSVQLDSNKLTHVDGLALDGSSTWDTKELNLSRNEIEVFEEWFLKLQNMEYLDLSSNKIKTLSNNYMDVHKTKLTINLRNNTIRHIIGNFNDAGKARGPEGNNIVLYLSDNPFECDCLSTKILHDWNRRKILGDFEDLTCTNGVQISTIDVYLHCNRSHALIGLIGTSVIGTLLGLIILISIITRWNDIWKYISKNVLNRSTNDSSIMELRQDAVKPYDLFISYAHQDEAFVTENLLPTLEYEYGQKVCVHYRDWVVGELIPDQIIQSVENARMTIIVLTENFLMSDWSYLEFRTAHNLGLQEGKPRVILILLNESISKDERLSIDLKSYIAINSYLVWKDPYFWTKLEKRLSKGGHKLNIYEK